MKKILLYFLFIIYPFLSEAQKIVTFSGKILNPKSNAIHIKYIDNYLQMKEITAGSAIIDKEGKFGMTFEWSEAKPALLYHGDQSYRLFLIPGDKLKITLDTDKFYQTANFSGKGSEVNNFLTLLDFQFNQGAALQEYNESFQKYELEEFVIYINKRKVDQVKLYEETFINPPSQEFNNYILSAFDYSWAADRLNYLELHSFYNNKKGFVKVSMEYYNFLDKVKINNDVALSTYYYVHFLESYFNDLSYQQLTKKEKKKIGVASVKQYNSLYDLINQKLEGKSRDLMLAKLLYDAVDAGLTDAMKPKLAEYDSINENKAYRKILNELYYASSVLKKGSPAPDFSLPDISGKMVSLSDFKGKVVYIDIWASWCVACRAEIYHTKKLIEKYKDKDVVFLYVSIDTKADLWQKLIFEMKIPGVHLISGKHFESDVLKHYLASGIPHYALIDKQGNIAINNANSPSQGVFNEINDLLKQ